jgi:hypothetical protein
MPTFKKGLWPLLKSSTLRSALFFAIVTAFLLGVVKLFLLRFEAGDIYPAYSSLRSDPLGTRAFYESLENINRNLVNRNYRSLQWRQFKEPTTFFYLGAPVFDSESVSKEFISVFDKLTSSGGRLVMCFLPVEKKPASWRLQPCSRKESEVKASEKSQALRVWKTQSKAKAIHTQAENASPHNDEQVEHPRIDPSSDEMDRCDSLKMHWGLDFAYLDKPTQRADKVFSDTADPSIKGLSESLSWHTALYFDNLESSWRVIYAADGRPVVIERPYGNGTLVLCADSFFLSNEALGSERHPELLAWLIGASAYVEFDETHFGIYKHPGVINLIRKYRFHWFILAVVVLALLFIWKNSAYFVPPPKREDAGFRSDVISENDSTQGLISLLRRYIPTRRVLNVCIREWEQTVKPEKRFQIKKLEQITTAIQATGSQPQKPIDPVSEYNHISRMISEGRQHE